MTTDNDDWEDRDELTPEELAEFKGLLYEERDKVLDSLRKHIREGVGDAENLPDEADQAKDISDRAYLVRLADKEQKLLREIDHALKKFEDDEYGFCEGTGDLINPARLRLRPWTRYSIDYKESQERSKKALAGVKTGTSDGFDLAGKRRKKRVKDEFDEGDPTWNEADLEDEVPAPDDDIPEDDIPDDLPDDMPDDDMPDDEFEEDIDDESFDG